MPEADAYRLPRTVRPTRYVLTLEPDIAGATFSGQEAVSVEIVEPVEEIVLNALGLEIDEAWIERAEGGERRDATVTLDETTERAHLALDGVAEPGAWVLHARFRGELNDRLVGFYRSTFTDDERRRTGPRGHAARGDPRPRGVSVLGRARVQGGLLGDVGRPRRSDGAVQRR